jgi:hypothetical protein
MNVQESDSRSADGAAAAAILAAAIGVVFLGIFTTLSEANTDFHDFADWWHRVGPLSGKSSLGLIVWLASWPFLHLALFRRDGILQAAIVVSAVLFMAGMILMFPPVFERIAEAFISE